MSMAKLYSIIGVDGSGKDYWLQECFRRLPEGSGFFPLPSTQYHQSPYCAAPGLSKLFHKLGKQADLTGDAALKAMSLFLKMMLFPVEYRHLQQRYKATTIISARHPAIDTVAYSRLFLRDIPLGRPAEEDHLLRARRLLEEAEWLQLEGFLQGVKAHGQGGSLEALIIETGRKELAAQLEAYAAFFGMPFPDKLLFLETRIGQAEQNLAARNDAVPEVHEKAEYLLALQSELQNCIGVLRSIAPQVEVKEILPTLGQESREDILAFLTE